MRISKPVIENVKPFDELISSIESKIKILAHPDENLVSFRKYLSSINKSQEVAILIGPEGGFSPGEVEAAKGKGWVPLNFGFTTLRTETAAVVIPAIVIYEMGF